MVHIGGLDIRVLGPFAVYYGERRVALGGTKQRVLLAHLALHPGEVVSGERLTGVLWPSGPPASAKANLHSYVWRLRKVLPDDRIVRDGNGYRLRVADDELDSARFTALLDQAGGRADSATDDALGLLAEAERLWRGEPFDDLPDVPEWRGALARLTEARLAALELRLECWLRLRRHHDVIAESRALLAEHPYREELWQHLVVALAATGRRAEALAAYASARTRLVDDLGVEPGPVLRAAQAKVLAESLAPSPGDSLGCALPPAVADFTGRAAELTALVAVLTGGGTSGAPPLAVVTGPPGTGKSALALQAAHSVRAHFPDGQLYARLGGKTSRAGARGRVLPERLPDAGSFRALLANRRVLVVLDDVGDAADVEQVLPLLPAGAGCAVLVAGRARLSQLPGAHRVELSGLPPSDALALLGTIVGDERLVAEPEAAREIVRRCAFLPLAVRAVAARLADRPEWPLRLECDRLVEEPARPARLRSGTLRVAERLAASLSGLDPTAAILLDLLARLGTPGVPGWAAALLVGADDDAMDELVEASLVRPVALGLGGEPRYQVPELLRWHVAGRPLAPAALPALRRAVEGWLALARRAARGLPVSFGATVTGPVRWGLAEDRADRAVADPRAWFDGERDALRTVTALAADSGMGELAWQLAAAAVPYFDLRGHYPDWHDGHVRALATARDGADREGEAVLSRGLGQVLLYWDDFTAAESHMARSAELAAESGDARGEAVAVAGLGTLRRVDGRPLAALRHYWRALATLERVGDEHSVAQLRGAIGVTWSALGHRRRARRWLTRALALARRIGDGHREALLLGQLAELQRRCGDVTGALRTVRTAVAALEDLDDECCAAAAHLVLARSLLAHGERTATAAAADRAAEVYSRTGNGWGKAQALDLITAAT